MNLGGVIHLNKTGVCILFAAALVLFIYMTTGSSESKNASQKINLRQLLKVAVKAAENGGKDVVATKDNLSIQSKGLTKEGMQDSVTTADFLSHCSIMATLKHAYPTLNVISEEAKTECDKNLKVNFSDIIDFVPKLDDQWENVKDVTVWIDPLDATHEYTEKLYDYVTTMVCVAVNGQPIIGVIHKPFLKDGLKTSWAWTGKAKSPNLKYVKNSTDTLKIIISMSHSGEIKKKLDDSIKKYELIKAAGAGYKALEVANGNVDAYLHTTAIKKWDICAGNAIINAMGGKMTTKFNELIDYKDSIHVQNDKGLIATINHHDMFIEKF